MEESLPWSDDGGVGGNEYFETDGEIERTPVVFIHGNSSSHSFWKHYMNYLIDKDYIGDEIWSVNISDRELTHRAFAERVDKFVKNVCDYCDVDEVCLVSHSLGVTSSRYWMENYDSYDMVSSFVGICGANHGLPLCPPSRVAKNLPDSSFARPCEFLSSDGGGEYHYSTLNEGSETPKDVEYYTIRGSKDKLFTFDKDSPVLEGANSNIQIRETHMGMRNNDVAIELVCQWCLEHLK